MDINNSKIMTGVKTEDITKGFLLLFEWRNDFSLKLYAK